MKTKGIDISTWQKPSQINYDQLAKEVDFVILRAGYTGHGTGVSLHKMMPLKNTTKPFTREVFLSVFTGTAVPIPKPRA